MLAAMIARHGDNLGEALAAYERMRAPRATAAVLGSRARAKENHLASPWARLKRDVRLALRERFGGRDNTAFQTAWLYDYDVAREAGEGSDRSPPEGRTPRAQNREEAPSPSFASLTRPLPARRGEVAKLAFPRRAADIGAGRLAVDEPLANRVRSGRKQP